MNTNKECTVIAHKFGAKWRSDDVKLQETVEFSALLISDPILEGLRKSGFRQPSPIQLRAIPVGRCGADMIVQAKSGTGKTCVFAVLALEHLKKIPNLQVLILTPTREIAVQVCTVIRSIGRAIPTLQCHMFIGGTMICEDIVNLRYCQIAVGTPGRVKQLMEMNAMLTTHVSLLILDEVDKLTEKSFQDDINWIYNHLSKRKQIIALSATYPNDMAEMLKDYMTNPNFVSTISVNELALKGVVQFYQIVPFHPLPHVNFQQKMGNLVHILETVRFSQCLIFCNYITRVKTVCDMLRVKKFPVASISSSDDQMSRLKTMKKLKSFLCRILVSSDLTSRGIDVENVNLVINMDLSSELETHLHRIGRAGRYGTRAVAITLVCAGNEEEKLKQYAQQANFKIHPIPKPLPKKLVQWAEDESKGELIDASESSDDESEDCEEKQVKRLSSSCSVEIKFKKYQEKSKTSDHVSTANEATIPSDFNKSYISNSDVESSESDVSESETGEVSELECLGENLHHDVSDSVEESENYETSIQDSSYDDVAESPEEDTISCETVAEVRNVVIKELNDIAKQMDDLSLLVLNSSSQSEATQERASLSNANCIMYEEGLHTNNSGDTSSGSCSKMVVSDETVEVQNGIYQSGVSDCEIIQFVDNAITICAEELTAVILDNILDNVIQSHRNKIESGGSSEPTFQSNLYKEPTIQENATTLLDKILLPCIGVNEAKSQVDAGREKIVESVEALYDIKSSLTDYSYEKLVKDFEDFKGEQGGGISSTVNDAECSEVELKHLDAYRDFLCSQKEAFQHNINSNLVRDVILENISNMDNETLKNVSKDKILNTEEKPKETNIPSPCYGGKTSDELTQSQLAECLLGQKAVLVNSMINKISSKLSENPLESVRLSDEVRKESLAENLALHPVNEPDTAVSSANKYVKLNSTSPYGVRTKNKDCDLKPKAPCISKSSKSVGEFINSDSNQKTHKQFVKQNKSSSDVYDKVLKADKNNKSSSNNVKINKAKCEKDHKVDFNNAIPFTVTKNKTNQLSSWLNNGQNNNSNEGQKVNSLTKKDNKTVCDKMLPELLKKMHAVSFQDQDVDNPNYQMDDIAVGQVGIHVDIADNGSNVTDADCNDSSSESSFLNDSEYEQRYNCQYEESSSDSSLPNIYDYSSTGRKLLKLKHLQYVSPVAEPDAPLRLRSSSTPKCRLFNRVNIVLPSSTDDCQYEHGDGNHEQTSRNKPRHHKHCDIQHTRKQHDCTYCHQGNIKFAPCQRYESSCSTNTVQNMLPPCCKRSNIHFNVGPETCSRCEHNNQKRSWFKKTFLQPLCHTHNPCVDYGQFLHQQLLHTLQGNCHCHCKH